MHALTLAFSRHIFLAAEHLPLAKAASLQLVKVVALCRAPEGVQLRINPMLRETIPMILCIPLKIIQHLSFEHFDFFFFFLASL